jgi:DNA-binding transcriptional ArsR family regulator
MLAKSDHTAGDISKGFAMTPQAVSQHLRTMLRARLVSQRRVGPSRMYRLNK